MAESQTDLIHAILISTLKGKIYQTDLGVCANYQQYFVTVDFDFTTWNLGKVQVKSNNPVYRMLFWNLLLDNNPGTELTDVYLANYSFVLTSDFRRKYSISKSGGIDHKDESLFVIDSYTDTNFFRLVCSVLDNGWSSNQVDGYSYGWTETGYQRIKFTRNERLKFGNKHYSAQYRDAFQLFLEKVVLPKMASGKLSFNSKLDTLVDEPRMYFVVNADAKMSHCKIASQVGHAAMMVAAHMLSHGMIDQYQEYVDNGMPKIVLKASSSIIETLIADPHYGTPFVVRDVGFTQVQHNTITVVTWLPMTYHTRDITPTLRSLKLL